MSNNQVISKRYAKAFFQATLASGATDDVEKNIDTLQAVFKENSELLDVLNNRTIQSSCTENILADICRKLKCHELTKNFIALLVRERRAGYFLQISNIFKSMVDEDKKKLSVNVESPRPLTISQTDQLNDILHRRTKKNIHLNMTINPDLIGGIIIQYGSEKRDFSVREKLRRLKQELEGLR